MAAAVPERKKLSVKPNLLEDILFEFFVTWQFSPVQILTLNEFLVKICKKMKRDQNQKVAEKLSTAKLNA